jgi:ATP/maltotriose-dependent transcriptional regulator MalT
MATAKKHGSNVFQLGVENRTQAAAKGRNLGLCE